MNSTIEYGLAAFIYAVGDAQRMDLLVSPVVRDTDPVYAPAAEFIREHGLGLVDATIQMDAGWLLGRYEHRTYVR
ncbi:hypothetical protein BST43_23410 [Mycobacteroides saopaulense]|uniref:Uncharacterized protein n=1 Tax=Mycobacteroides saopaulense TaxID=1578165 RepID=A0A1X0IMD6_9MYCO|nr:hypothetical protein [Mycobacteroides saopaulense]ORB49413.1 hypothetical protein BST43_23410 [Mycobacteroides saopaulense]